VSADADAFDSVVIIADIETVPYSFYFYYLHFFIEELKATYSFTGFLWHVGLQGSRY